MILFLHGEDLFLVNRRKRALMAAFTQKYATSEVFIFDFEDQGAPADVSRALSACESGLFATEKMVVFLHPFTLEEKGEKMLTTFLKEQVKALPEHTILLFVHTGKLKKSHPLTKVLIAHLDKEEVYDLLDGRALETFIQKELASFHPAVQFAPEALRQFIALTDGDMARMISELEKLALFVGEGNIQSQDIATLLALPEESSLWQALDALGRGDRKEALLLFRQEVDKGEGVFPVFSMCAWQVRRLLLIREAYDQGIRRPGDIASATKLPPFTVQKAMSTIASFSPSRLKQGLALLSDIDTKLKQGKADPEASLDLFVWKF